MLAPLARAASSRDMLRVESSPVEPCRVYAGTWLPNDAMARRCMKQANEDVESTVSVARLGLDASELAGGPALRPWINPIRDVHADAA